MRRRLLFEQLAQGAPGCRVQWYLTFLEALAAPYPDGAAPIAENDVTPPQRRHLADPQAGLEHELHEGIIASGETMGTFASGTQQAVHVGGRQTEGSALVSDPNRLDLES